MVDANEVKEPAKVKRPPVVVHPNATKSLRVLDDEWQGCERCDLSVQRDEARFPVITGGGKSRGILFVGESPGIHEGRTGHPFSNNGGGRILQKCLARYRISVSYATYLVGCRACAPVLDGQGLPRLYPPRNGSPGGVILQEQPPTVPQMDACAPRLYEEIYIVDPVIIVAMGSAAASYLAKSSINIKKMRGTPMEIEVPGAGYTAVFSEKKHEWQRKVKGVDVLPTKQSIVRYMMIPTYDSGFAFDHRHDTTNENSYRNFTKDICLAKQIYDRYHEEISGAPPELYDESIPDDILEEMLQEDKIDG